MGTLVSQNVEVGVNVLGQSVTGTTNWVFQLLLKATNLRDLAPDHLLDRREIIEKGLFTWLAEQTLEVISLEIFEPGREDALERFDHVFSYLAEPDMTVRNPDIAEVEAFCSTLQRLPASAQYRIAVSVRDGATVVEGWREGALRPLSVTKEQRLSDHGYGVIGTQFVYRGGAW
jgi:hypothetical protein